MSRFNPLGYEQITGLNAAKSLNVPSGSQLAIIRVSTQGVRWRDDGIDPTASIGMPLAANDTITFEGELSRLRFIEQSASAVLDVSYYA